MFRAVVALLLFFSGCAMAQTPYSGSPSRPRSAAQHYTMMKQRAESDFHYLLSHLLQFSSNQEQNYLNRAVDEMHRALRTQSHSSFLHLELARLHVKQGDLNCGPAGLPARHRPGPRVPRGPLPPRQNPHLPTR